MGGLLSITWSDIYMAKMEDDMVENYQPVFYKRYHSLHPSLPLFEGGGWKFWPEAERGGGAEWRFLKRG